MTAKERYCLSLLRAGRAASVTRTTGTTCPCMTWRDPNNPQYSAEYHRQYPDAEDCKGTGVISGTATTVNIKANFFNPRTATSTIILAAEIQESIGELQNDDLIMMGAVQVSDASFYDMSDIDANTDYVTIGSRKYRPRTVIPVETNAEIGQVVLLKRYE